MKLVGGKKIVSAKVVALKTMLLTAADFVPGDGLSVEKQGEAPARVASGVITGKALKQTIPVYPQTAKDRHVSGTVVLHALIGRDGHVHRSGWCRIRMGALRFQRCRR